MNRIRSVLASSATFFLPLVAFASAPTFADIVKGGNGAIGVVPFIDRFVVPLLYALAFLFILFGLFKYFFTGGEENRKKSREFVLYAFLGMVVLFGVWGLVKLLLSVIPGT